MSDYTVISKTTREILKSGVCQKSDVTRQARPGEFVVGARINDATHKAQFDGFDNDGKPVNLVFVEKTQSEIDAGKPPAIDPQDRRASISQKQYDELLQRIDNLEGS